MLLIDTTDRIRILTLDRPEAKNAFNEALYDELTDGLLDAAADNGVAVVVITGSRGAFSAGTDLFEMAQRMTPEGLTPGRHGFPGLIDTLIGFEKPIFLAVNGLGLGIGATMLGLADLVFMSTDARIKCPFTGLGVAPEAGSSATFPLLLGRQNATWALLSSEWLSARECQDMGLVWRVCEPSELMDTTLEYARVLSAKPISSLIESKRTIVEPLRVAIHAARERENAAFAKLMGGPANTEALKAFAEKRQPDFTTLPAGW
jgi:enoyl-CoA hydratase/carnithine racemase